MVESAGWHPDPSRRHEYRYSNGSVWTEFVADRGVVAVDPLIAAAYPWRQIGITAAVVILALGAAVASSSAASDQSQTARKRQAVDRPAPRTVPTTTAPSVPATPTQAFLHAAHDLRAGPLAAESDAALLDLGRAGCNALNAGLPASFLSSSMHTHEPDVTLAQARYFVASVRLLCPGRSG